jgi:rfaE bifunctional protein kinase chain/domain
MVSIADLRPWVPRLADHRLLVIGDVILDEYLIGTTNRMSREAPVPVLELQERRYIPGGAANPSSNIVALGSHAVQVGVVGGDSAAQTLRLELQARQIDTSALVTCPERPTTLKTRIMAQMGLRFPQQVARIDTLTREPIDETTITTLMQHIQQQEAQAILVSDYHTGLLVPDFLAQIQAHALTKHITLIADAQGQLDKYVGWHVVKCNAEDASRYLDKKLNTDADFDQATRMLYERLDLRQAMIITRGAKGATVLDAHGRVTHLPAPVISDVFDTVGAGDTSIAVMALALTAGANIQESVMLANVASGIVVRHVGNYTPSPDELLNALS